MDTQEAWAPTGSPIIGTAEQLEGTAACTFDADAKSAGDDRAYDHSGGTDMDWDGSETRTLRGETLFIDDSGETWPASQVRLGGEGEPLSKHLRVAMRLRNQWADMLDRAVQIGADWPVAHLPDSHRSTVIFLESVVADQDANLAAMIAAEAAPALTPEQLASMPSWTDHDRNAVDDDEDEDEGPAPFCAHCGGECACGHAPDGPPLDTPSLDTAFHDNEMDVDDGDYPGPCTDPGGHVWPSELEERDRCLCIHCGADGDA